MGFFRIIALVWMGIVLTGCMSTVKIQEMIDQSTQEVESKIVAHDESISKLKKSTKTGIDQGANNALRLEELEQRMSAVSGSISDSHNLANAAKVISTENTVKLFELAKLLAFYKRETDAQIDKMTTIDKLYKEVLIQQYQSIADSANAAIKSLRKNEFSATTNAPIDLNKPIEIVPPETFAPVEDSSLFE